MSNRSKRRASNAPYRRVRLGIEELESRDVPSSTVPDVSIDSSQFASDHILVRWLDNTPVNTSLSSGSQAIGNNTYDVHLARGVTVAQAVDYYSKLAGVDFAQPDYVVKSAMVPNDTYIGYQWALSAINAQSAWNYTTGGTRIIVAVVDTGADNTDTDLAPNIIPGYNFVNNTTNTMDDNGHGTHVSGIIGAVGNNQKGVAGVDWNVEIMPLKFMDASGQGYLSNAVSAINYAVGYGARIINNSWGGGGYDAALASAIQNAQAHGVIFVAAAGNNSSNNDVTPEYPANYTYNNVISVAATDQNNNLASFSDYGAGTVTIAAPGVSILSTTPNNTYSYYSGTSMATPFVTGALALVWSIHPDWSYTQVIADVLNNTDHLASLNGKVQTGLLDLGKAIAAAEPPPTPAPAPTPAPVTPAPAPAQPTTPTTPGSYSSGTVNIAFSGKQTVTSTVTVNQHMTIGALTATVNIQNTIDSALQVTLVSPSGQQILLFNRRGGSGSNLTNTTFADSSTNAIYRASAPFSGSVRPEYALSAFKNQDAYGTWKLVVTSIASNDAGAILNWSLNVSATSSATKTASVEAEQTLQTVPTVPALQVTTLRGAAALSTPATWIHVQSTAGNNLIGQNREPNAGPAANQVSTVSPSVPDDEPAVDAESADDDQAETVDSLIAALFVKV